MIKPKLFILTILMVLSVSARAFTIEGLLGFMHKEVTKDAPANWTQVVAIFVMNEIDGKNNVKVSYLATVPTSKEPISFQISNLWGPINAASKIKELSGDTSFTTLEVYMKPDGSSSYSTR